MPAHGAVRASGGMLLITGTDGTVTGVNGASGKAEWTGRIPGQSTPYFTSFAGDTLAYATSTSDDGSSTHVTAVDPDTGDVRWDAHLDGSLEPFDTEDGSVYFLSIDPVYGQTKALVIYAPVSESTRTMVLPVRRELARATVHAGVVYLLAIGGSLDALDMGTRKRLWHLETSVSRGSTPVVDSGHLYFSAADGRLLAFDTEKGRLVGQTPPRLRTNSDRVMAALPEPVLADGHVYATAPDGTVFAVDGRDPSRW
ncbi:PQQ-binding-like beta-propeller repeat protein [Streptomyces chiangmaiensis]